MIYFCEHACLGRFTTIYILLLVKGVNIQLIIGRSGVLAGRQVSLKQIRDIGDEKIKSEIDWYGRFRSLNLDRTPTFFCEEIGKGKTTYQVSVFLHRRYATSVISAVAWYLSATTYPHLLQLHPT